MRPSEVLDAQVDLATRLDDDRFRQYLGGMMLYSILNDTEAGAATMRQAVKTAYAYRVTEDMSMLVHHAANSLDEVDQFDAQLAPTGAGFVAFDKALPVHDARGETMLLHYMIWSPCSFVTKDGQTVTGTAMFAFNDGLREPDDMWRGMWHREIEKALGSALLSGDVINAEFDNRRANKVDLAMNDEEHAAYTFQANQMLNKEIDNLSVEDVAATRQMIGRWATIGLVCCPNGSTLGPEVISPSAEHAAMVVADGYTPTAGTNMVRYLHALWLMMNQTIAVTHEEDVDRSSRRRAKRFNMPGKVTVIKLRREEAHREPGETNVEWAHRWVVRGHWRWQVCGEQHPLAQEIEPGKWRCRIWIHSYEKGPEGAPLVITDKVYSLER